MPAMVGQYRQRITLQSETRTRDAMGGFASSWSDVATVWAEVRYGRIQTGEFVDAVLTRAMINIRTRYRTDLTQAMRIVWEGETYQINSLSDPDGRRRELKISAIRV